MKTLPPKLEKLVDRIHSIPTLPQVMLRVNSLLADPNTSSTDVADMIATDQALTVKILKLVNSAYYGLSRKILRINQAVSILGFETTRAVLVTTSILEAFASRGGDRKWLDLPQLWVHSLGVASTARLLGQAMRLTVEAEDLYVAGLLHDVGRIILYQEMTEEFYLVLQKVRDEDCTLHEAETSVLEFTHEDLGTLLATRWDFPEKLIVAVGSHHHLPADQAEYKKFSSLIHLADILCKIIDLGDSGDDFLPDLDMEAWKASGVTLEIVDRVLYQLRGKKKSIEDVFFDLTS